MQSLEKSLNDPHERRKTDKSLKVERIKADESLQGAQEAVEQTNDRIIQAKRLIADSTRSKERNKVDAKQANNRHGDVAKVAEENAVIETLEDERHRAEAAIQAERALADAALEKERANRRIIEDKFLDRERRETDKNLAQEREQADLDLQSVAISLANAQQTNIDITDALTTRDEFIAIVSHDLRNPIGAISSCATTLLEDFSDAEISGELRSWIELIKRNADTALRLVSDLLDVERISTGKLVMQTGTHDIFELMKHAAESFINIAAAKSITLRTVHPKSPIIVICDRDRISQVLSNLISNALNFSPEHGTVTIRADALKDIVQVSVCDTGPGIPPDKKDVIFERFSQLGNKNRRGLGLGLYIAKKILKAHHGKLWVESTLGCGSRFMFTLTKKV